MSAEALSRLTRALYLGLVAAVLVAAGYSIAADRARLDTPAAAKAGEDLRAIATAVSAFYRHTGRLPVTLADLQVPVLNSAGVVGGPFMPVVPAAPSGWGWYRYRRHEDGTFEISATGGPAIKWRGGPVTPR
jgi:hypothetical protein